MSTIEGDEEELTRKQRREQARAQRKELEQAAASDAARRRRLKQLGIVVGIAIAIVAGIVIATSGGSKSSITKPQSKQANKVVAELSSLLGGIPQNGNVLGSPTAPVTLQYFGDLECPICKAFSLNALPTLIRNYVRAGKLKIEYHAMQTATPEPSTFDTQHVAALAAGKQQKMWNYIELFYSEQGEEHTGYVTEAYLQGLAKQIPGLNLTAWTAARNNPEYVNMLTSDAQTVNKEGFTGTPSFLIGKTGTTLRKLEPGIYNEAAPYTAAVESLLKH
jgi:protein-disulfide isomerase